MILSLRFRSASLTEVSNRLWDLTRDEMQIRRVQLPEELGNAQYSILAKEFENGEVIGKCARETTSLQRESNMLANGLVSDAKILIDYAGKAQGIFDLAEEGLRALANIFTRFISQNPYGKAVLDVFKKFFSNDEALKETIRKIEQAEIEFEKVIAVIIQNAFLYRQAIEDDLRVGEGGNAFNESIQVYMQRKRIPDSFTAMNVDGLIGENPDILRKGVTQGFSGEYWDPNVKEQCTFYAATRRTQLGKPLPSNGPWGNAVSWANSAARAGLEVSKTPAPGDVFCQKGTWGHVGVVEGVLEDGTIVISEANNDFKGGFGVRKVSPRAYASWQFIK